MKLKVFCQQVTGQAPQPGQSVKIARFQGVGGTPAGENGKKATPSPNAHVFRDGEGHINIDLANLVKDEHALLEEGKTYIVEIREAGPGE